MTINIADNNPRVSYSVSAGVTQTSFAVPFEFFDETDVLVYIGSTLKTLNTDYTISGGDGTTGTITMSVTGPATVALVRDVTIERSTDFPTAGPFSVQSLNVELDKQIAIDADISDQIDRAVRSPIEEFTTMTLPDAATRADKLLKFDTDGNVAVESASALVGGAVVGANFVNNTFTGDGSQTAFTTTVEAGSKNNAQVYIDGVYQLKSSFSVSGTTLTFTEAPPLNSQIEVIIGNAIDTVDADSGNVNYNQGGTGAQTRTVENKLQEFVSVKDFGATGDGVTDDTAAFNNAFAVGGDIFVPEGTYKITQTITIPYGARLSGQSENVTSAVKQTKLLFAPTGADTNMFRFEGAGQCDFRFISFYGSGGATEIGFNMDNVAPAGSERRNSFYHCNFRDWGKAAVYLSGQWMVSFDYCDFRNNGNDASPSANSGAIVFADTGSGWAGSGNTISNTYMSGNVYALYIDGGYDITCINVLMEDNDTAFLKTGIGSATNFIGCWFEDNTNPPDISRAVYTLNCRGEDFTNHDTSSANQISVKHNASGIYLYETSTPFLAFTGDGIDFSGVGTAANIFDEYEEGVWNPTLATSGTNFTSVTYDAFTKAKYIKTGNQVTVYGTLRTDAITVGSASGAVLIGSLPFVAKDNDSAGTRDGVAVGSVANCSGWAVDTPISVTTDPASTTLVLQKRATSNGDDATVDVADVATGANANRMAFSCTYLTN